MPTFENGTALPSGRSTGGLLCARSRRGFRNPATKLLSLVETETTLRIRARSKTAQNATEATGPTRSATCCRRVVMVQYVRTCHTECNPPGEQYNHPHRLRTNPNEKSKTSLRRHAPSPPTRRTIRYVPQDDKSTRVKTRIAVKPAKQTLVMIAAENRKCSLFFITLARCEAM